jgi:hypothetical protein
MCLNPFVREVLWYGWISFGGVSHQLTAGILVGLNNTPRDDCPLWEWRGNGSIRLQNNNVV